MSMRKYFFVLLTLFIPAFTFAEILTVDNGYKEKITSYSVEATLKDNASIDVSETITYDFGTNEKHGIFRYIPTVYRGRRGNPRQNVRVLAVTEANGKGIKYEKSNENDSLVIKIGSPNDLVTGVRTYKIHYLISHMVSSDKDEDRFLWNAIGTGWNVPIQNAIISLHLSDRQAAARQTFRCYVGAQGSAAPCEYTGNASTTRIGIKTLYPNMGVTVDSTFTSGTFPPPGKVEMFFWSSHWYYWLPLIGFLGFFALWFERGRDPKGRGTIVPIYDAPKDLTPYEASIIMDDIISRKSLPAAIISLATQGYVKIHRKEVKGMFVSHPEYELELLKPLPETAPAIDQSIVKLFFEDKTIVNLKDLGSNFQRQNASLHTRAYQEVTAKGYFVVNPTISRIIFFAISVALFVAGILAGVYFLASPLGFVCFSSPGIIGFIFAFFMPVKTKDGSLMREYLLGLKMYIKTAEIDRIKFHNAPKKNPEKFEELLPYAIIFGLEKEWAEEFQDIYKNPPTWYDGNLATFSVIALTHDLSSFSDTAINAATSASSSSGGGFGGVGGGGGGGGGGSW